MLKVTKKLPTDTVFAEMMDEALGRRPKTAAELAAVTGFDAATVARRMREWCEAGRAVGRIMGEAHGQIIIGYRRAK